MIDNEKWRSFIKEYKNLPELWNIKSDKYKNKTDRHKAYCKLLKEYRKIYSTATILGLKKKIANMRTCYRRELKKIKQSERNGSDSNDIYITSLWYFDLLDFLKDLEMPIKGRSNNKNPNTVINVQPKIKSNNNSTDVGNVRTEFLKKATEHLEKSKKDDAATYADGWACMLRKMPLDQQLYAKQAVDEILLLGRLNKLFLNYMHSSPPTGHSIVPDEDDKRMVFEIATTDYND